MSKFYRSVLAAGAVALGLAACGDNVTVTNPPPVTAVVHSVTVVPQSQTVLVGQTGVTFVASVVADSGKVSTVHWSSTNQAVATVNATSGLISALTPGQATIVATSDGDGTKTGAGSLTVVALPSNISAFSVTPTNGTIAVGGTLQGNSSVTTIQGAPTAVITWASSNSNIASVNANGTITGVSAGAAIITATATSGTQTATATIGVTVGVGPTGVVSFSVSPSAMTLFATQTQQATATITMAPTFTAPTVTWTSLAPTVATVSGTGLVTAVAQGTAVINATIGTAPNTLTQSVVVTVAQGASISIASITAGATAGTIAGCAGIANTPVVLTNVNCQIDVNMNLNAGVQPIDSLVVRMKQPVTSTNPTGFKTLAKQNYGNTIPSSGLVTLSINTANFVKVPTTSTVINGVTYPAGTVAVDLFNGPTNLLTQIYPHVANGGQVTNCQVGAGDATCAVVNSMVLNNADGWSADIQKCSAGTGTIVAVNPVCPAAAPSTGTSGAVTGTNTSTGGFANNTGGGAAATAGFTYWGGPTGSGQTTAEIYAVIYNDNPTFPSGAALNRCNNTLGNNTGCINSVTWSIGIPVPNTGGNTTATTPNGAQWCAAVTQTTLPFRRTFGTGAGATSSCGNYENVTLIRDNVDITASIDGVNNPFVLVGTLVANAVSALAQPNFVLIPNTVVFGSTPDSARYDYIKSGTVVSPTIIGAESQNWVNKNWIFKPGGGLITDGGVGPAAATWASFCSNGGAANSNCAQGGSATFTTLIVTGNDAVMVETNTKTSDAYTAVALGTDLLGNGAASGAVGTFGVDRSSPLVRISIVGAPSSEGAGVYLGGGAGGTAVLDSTVYNAVENVYGALVATAGARTHFLSAAYGTGDSLRVEAIDGRSGLRRAIGTTVRFAQNGVPPLNGASTTVQGYNCTGCFLPGTVDGWLPVPALHVLAGAALTGLQTVSGYYTTTEYVVDNAGNVSGCPFAGAVSGSVCTASVASTTINSNPAMAGGLANQLPTAPPQQNLFGRRTLALDIAQPQITGVSPNNSYTGNNPATFTLGSADDLEVIDSRFRIQYPNLTIGDVGGTITAAPGLVWSYALSNTFMATGFSAGPSSGPAFAPATAAVGVNFGFFAPINIRFDGAVNALAGNGTGIVNPLTQPVSIDQFTLNVQETCTNAGASVSPYAPGTGLATGPTASCGVALVSPAVGDPIPQSVTVGFVPPTKPTFVGVQVRDVFGSWVFNDNPGITVAQQLTGVSPEATAPLLPATIAAPGGYSVSYYNAGATTSCPMGGAVQPANTTTCVSGGINFRGDVFYTPTLATTIKVFRATEALSNTLPIFTRVELYGLNALGQWVFISRITVPQGIGAIPTSAGCPATAAGLTAGSVLGCDNGNERYWFYTFTSAGTAFLEYRAIGVNAAGFGLASTVN